MRQHGSHVICHRHFLTSRLPFHRTIGDSHPPQVKEQRSMLDDCAKTEHTVLVLRDEIDRLNASMHIVMRAVAGSGAAVSLARAPAASSGASTSGGGARAKRPAPAPGPAPGPAPALAASPVVIAAASVPPLVPATSVSTGNEPPIAVLLLCYNGPEDLERTLRSVLRLRPAGAAFPLFISQDGDHAGVARVIQDAVRKQQALNDPITALQFQFQGIKAVPVRSCQLFLSHF
jgi:hypothetical protein